MNSISGGSVRLSSTKRGSFLANLEQRRSSIMDNGDEGDQDGVGRKSTVRLPFDRGETEQFSDDGTFDDTADDDSKQGGGNVDKR